jgi:glycosyltransferase involved in cell wall biosynthesis
MALSACFVSSVQYPHPLDPTSEKKYRALKELGEFLVIGFATGLRPDFFVQEARFRLLPRLPTPLLRYPLLFTVGSAYALASVLRGGADVLVAQSPYEGFAAAMVKSAARLLGKRVALVVESHGDFEISPFLQRRTHLPAVHRFLIRRLSRYSFRRADALRAISDSTRRQLENWAPGKPIVQFPTWTDMESFLKVENSGSTNEERFFLYVGVLIPRKAVDLLIDGFAQIADTTPDCGLVIIGRAEDESYHRLLVERVEGLGISSRVRFHPPMRQSDLARHMARAQALVLPSVSEGLGRVVFEAMACGIPVIGSKVGGIVDMVAEGVNGFLVPPGDVGALSEKMSWILAHPDEARRMGQKAREFARGFFSREAYVVGYRRLIDQAREMALSDGRRESL